MNPNDSKTPAIVAENLTKVYGSGNTEVVAMKDVSLRVARGEVIALLGPSGAGKSTLLTAIGLINPPTSGRIHIGGELVMDADQAKVDLREFRRRHLGFVFQKANLIPFLNAVENVQVALEINDASPAPHTNARWNCSITWESRTGRRIFPTPFPEDSNNVSRWPAHLPTSQV